MSTNVYKTGRPRVAVINCIPPIAGSCTLIRLKAGPQSIAALAPSEPKINYYELRLPMVLKRQNKPKTTTSPGSAFKKERQSQKLKLPIPSSRIHQLR